MRLSFSVQFLLKAGLLESKALNFFFYFAMMYKAAVMSSFDEFFNDYNPAFLLALYDVKRFPLIFQTFA